MVCTAFSFGCNDLIDIDPEISSLVFILNYSGLKTKASCQGHYTDWHYQFPWVCIQDKDIDALRKIVSDYNSVSSFNWVISLHEASKEWLLRPYSVDRSLEQMHREVFKLTHFLSRRLIKKERLA